MCYEYFEIEKEQSVKVKKQVAKKVKKQLRKQNRTKIENPTVIQYPTL